MIQASLRLSELCDQLIISERTGILNFQQEKDLITLAEQVNYNTPSDLTHDTFKSIMNENREMLTEKEKQKYLLKHNDTLLINEYLFGSEEFDKTSFILI